MSALFAVDSSFVLGAAAATELYTLSLHDALPISERFGHQSLHVHPERPLLGHAVERLGRRVPGADPTIERSEEHTSELQSRRDLVCRLLLEKKKSNEHHHNIISHIPHHAVGDLYL